MKKMAVLDDSAFVRSILRFMIPKSEWDVVCYSDPQELVRDLEEGKWDAILTDYDMPGLTGYELVRISKRFAPHTKLIMISANRKIVNLHPDINRFVEALLYKPFSRSTLVNAIQSLP